MGEGREARKSGSTSGDLAASPFRADRDRIVASPFFARLGGVTQVVSASGSGLLHNRLTHSLKVAQVARAIAERLSVAATPLVDRARRLRPRRRGGRRARPRPRPPAVRPPRRAGARPARPAPVRAARRVRGQRPELPHRHHHRHRRPGRGRPRPDRGRARRDAEVPVDPPLAPAPRIHERCPTRRGAPPSPPTSRAPGRASSPSTSPSSTTWSRPASRSPAGSRRGSRPSRRP